jgi:hypothetical protein
MVLPKQDVKTSHPVCVRLKKVSLIGFLRWGSLTVPCISTLPLQRLWLFLGIHQFSFPTKLLLFLALPNLWSKPTTYMHYFSPTLHITLPACVLVYSVSQRQTIGADLSACQFPPNLRRSWLACFMLVSCFTYYSTMKMEVIYSFKMLADFHWTTWNHMYILENGTHSTQMVILRDCPSMLSATRLCSTRWRMTDKLWTICQHLQASAWPG